MTVTVDIQELSTLDIIHVTSSNFLGGFHLSSSLDDHGSPNRSPAAAVAGDPGGSVLQPAERHH